MELKLKDGKILGVESNTNGFDAAKAISISLAKKAVAFILNGELHDLRDEITVDGDFELVLQGDEKSYDTISTFISYFLMLVKLSKEVWIDVYRNQKY